MTNLNDPSVRNEFERQADREGMSTATLAGIAVAIMLFGGMAIYAFSSGTTDVATNKASIEQSVPPATTGQGGAQSRMPAAKE